MTREQLQQIRDAVCNHGFANGWSSDLEQASAILDAALAAPEQEPVAWVEVTHSTQEEYRFHGFDYLPVGKHNLYIAPVAAPQIDLSDASIDRILRTQIPGGSAAADWFLPHEHPKGLENVRGVVRLMIESALKAKNEEKNHG